MAYSRGMLHPVRGDKMTAVEWNEFAKKGNWPGVMPDWEAELRDKLETELEDGGYHHKFEHEGRKHSLYTGKGGQIEIQVALHKAMRDQFDGPLKDKLYNPNEKDT